MWLRNFPQISREEDIRRRGGGCGQSTQGAATPWAEKGCLERGVIARAHRQTALTNTCRIECGYMPYPSLANALPGFDSKSDIACIDASLACLQSNGQGWIRTSEGVSQWIYSPPRLATPEPTRLLIGSVPQRPGRPREAHPGDIASGVWYDTGAEIAKNFQQGGRYCWRRAETMWMGGTGLLLVSAGWVERSSRISMPWMTWPKTVYWPSRSGIGLRQI